MGAANGAPSLASSVDIGAFNLGNAAGAAIGGLVIASGFSYPAVVITSSFIAALALAVVLITSKRTRQLEAAESRT